MLFLGFLVSWFLGFKVSWLLDFMVSKFQRFKYMYHVFGMMLVPYYHQMFIAYFLGDIDFILNLPAIGIVGICWNLSGPLFPNFSKTKDISKYCEVYNINNNCQKGFGIVIEIREVFWCLRR